MLPGCGEGKNAAYFALAGAQVRAIDVSEVAIANAHHAWPEVHNINWEVADIAALELPEEAYDVVCDRTRAMYRWWNQRRCAG